MKYDHKKIEPKWQKFWAVNKIFEVQIDDAKPKIYILDMFPYPSGSGLHVGHLVGYTATDVVTRYKRQRGFNVLHPMGWDSFGLPAEQYAIRTGTHPRESTQKNIDNFRKQLQAVGYSYDWSREIATSSPDYYKWTQWIFTKLYEKGLAYEADMLVNYCPALGTVLANEEVENGRAKEGGHLVERRPLRQWVLKITAYADRLLKDLDLIDWPEGLKKLQVNWIGRSEGAQIDFDIAGCEEKISVFTTRPDTLFAVTFMVLSPEHPLVEKISTEKQAVQNYLKQTVLKSDMERTEASKEKTGVFTGAYAINPVNQEKVPIWIADYVLMGYGTGAVMGVPAHDQRDFDFAKVFQIPVKAVFDPDFVHYPESVPAGADLEEYRKRVAAGQECWTGEGAYINSSNGDISLNGTQGIEQGCRKVIDWLEQQGVGQKTITYKLRDWLFSRQRYWAEPFPILHFEDGTRRVLELDELPLSPPEITDYKPSGDGQSPLAKVREWVEIIDPKTGQKALRETNTMPQWAGSCWYYLRFCDPHNTEEAWGKRAENYWLPVDLYVGGVEHAVLHLLYARFWHKVLYDCGYVHTPEPFQKLRNQGLVTARSYQRSNGAYVDPSEVEEREGRYYHRATNELLRSQIDKMSKSKLNGVSPDDVIEEFGADAIRLYGMFIGPFEKEKPWCTDAITGCYRFLNRFFDMATSERVVEEENEEALRLGHRLVHQVSQDIEAMQFNTAIAKMMEFMNEITKLPQIPKSVVKMAAQALMPFAPHAAEEIWEHLGCPEALSYCPYPEINKRYLEDEQVTYVIQVNGKLRGRFDLPKDKNQDEIFALARELDTVKRFVDGQEIAKLIFVPNKLLNIVVN
jgi:leucyl-tRNA synthetase